MLELAFKRMWGFLMATVELPPTFDPRWYRDANPDLLHLTEEQLVAHYQSHGQNEGRICTAISGRDDFNRLAASLGTALEIGPFFRPGLPPSTTDFFDVLDTEALRERATTIGQDPAKVPRIKWTDPNGSLSVVALSYDVCYSSHSVEHQPDLVGHLQEVEQILHPGGRYLLVVPDHRYCFDALLAPSTIADVMEAHVDRHRKHSLRSVIEHRALVTHNDVVAHWLGDNGDFELKSDLVARAIVEFETNDYLDVHAWKFTPTSFATIVHALENLGETTFRLERLYPTLRWTNEFFAVLRKH